MIKLTGHKTTFQAKGTNHYDLMNTINEIKENHDVRITQTDLINMAISELYNDIAVGNKSLIEVLGKYNLI